ncbi:hypothetical protein CR513_48281, partial [Mucuna pruriens]
MLASPPILTQPTPGTPLYLYISVSNDAFSAVLIQEKEKEQRPGHDIVVQTDLSIRQVLRKPDLAGRMVLADFIMELTSLESSPAVEGDWYLSIDGSSNHTGSGAGIVLEGSEGVLIEQSLHFEFRASNNQAEYEALLIGMRLAQELEAKRQTAKSDSKLVIRQVNEEYQASDPQLARYQE